MSESVMADIEAEARQDWLTFADITAILADDRGVELHVSPELVGEAVALAVSMVRAGRLVPGTLPDRLKPWALSTEDAARRIEREATILIAARGDIPLGEICWFTLPEYVEGENCEGWDNERRQ